MSERMRVVMKCGGAVAGEAAAAILELAEDHEVVVVHGAGPQISAEMERRGLEVRFVRGRRYTTAEALEVVRESLASVNASLCAALGPRALGLMGDEIGLEATQNEPLGLVGDPMPVPVPEVERALAEGRIPIVAPLARGPLNVNADEAAVALAAGVGAQQVVFLTDVPGVLLDGEVLAALDTGEAERLLAAGAFAGGIVPKLEAAIWATRLGLEASIGATVVAEETQTAEAGR